jgi:glutamyl-Q tRNA(Asp) synthetase
MPPLTRFAPSPNGWLHTGHALAALEVWAWAWEANATVLLRIEDIDHARCRPDYEAAIFNDLKWLGFDWPEPVMRQSERLQVYRDVLAHLRQQNLLYPCFCTRPEVRRNSGENGHEGPVYGGTCRGLSNAETRQRFESGVQAAWRLKLDLALEQAGQIVWQDHRAGTQEWDGLGWGDVVVARKDIGLSYHIAVTADDEAQQITDVVRGTDLFPSTHIHVLLQRLMGWRTPDYNHHPVLLDNDGVKLSKSSGARGLRETADQLGGRKAFFQHLKQAGAASSLFDNVGTVTDRLDE